MRVVLIIGVPSGGTSCIAGLFKACGFNLGQEGWLRGTKHRKYPLRECQQLTKAVQRIKSNDPSDFTRMIEPLRRYCEGRTEEWQTTGVPQAAKKPSLQRFVMDPTGQWKDIPADFVVVERPLEDVIASNQKHHPDYRDWQARLKYISESYHMREKFIAEHTPRMVVPFYGVLEDPQGWASRVCDEFDIEFTDDAREAVSHAIDQEMRHV